MILRHGEYLATVELDEERAVLVGWILNLSSPVGFEGRTVDDLKREFALSIQTYLDVCREQGIEPERPYSGRLNLRLPPDLHRKAAQAANAEGKSLNSWIVETIARSAA